MPLIPLHNLVRHPLPGGYIRLIHHLALQHLRRIGIRNHYKPHHDKHIRQGLPEYFIYLHRIPFFRRKLLQLANILFFHINAHILNHQYCPSLHCHPHHHPLPTPSVHANVYK